MDSLPLAFLIKIAWAKNERFAPIIGDVGINFLEQDVDLELDDYGVFIDAVPQILDDVQTFQNIIATALQSGALGQGERAFLRALKLLREPDITVAMRRFEREVSEAEVKEAQMQQQQMAQEQQLEMLRQQTAEKQLAAGRANIELKGRVDGMNEMNKLAQQHRNNLKEMTTEAKLNSVIQNQNNMSKERLQELINASRPAKTGSSKK